MKHPHYDVMMEWAADTSKVVQSRWYGGDWQDTPVPRWDPYLAYRIKPTPKPDVVRKTTIGYYPDKQFCYFAPYGDTPTLELTFDGETGELKEARMLK